MHDVGKLRVYNQEKGPGTLKNGYSVVFDHMMMTSFRVAHNDGCCSLLPNGTVGQTWDTAEEHISLSCHILHFDHVLASS
jgi:hypothetical protein